MIHKIKYHEQLENRLNEAGRRIAELEEALSRHEAAEKEFESRIDRHERLFASFPLGITITDGHGTIVEVNSEAGRILEIPREEHVGRAITSASWQAVRSDGTRMPAEEFPGVRALREKRLIENVVMGIVRKTGGIRWINVTAAPLPLEGCGVAIVYSDFTRGRKSEEDLVRSEEKYRKLFEEDLTGNFIAAADGRILMCNPSFVDIFGFSNREEALASNFRDLHLTPESFDRFISALRERKTLTSYMGRRRRRDGRIIYIVENTVGRFDENGELIDYKAYVFDITERKRFEERLRESEERFHIMADSSPLMIWVADEHGEIQFVNSSYRDFFRMSPEEIRGSKWRLLLHPDDKDAYVEAFLRAVSEKSPFHATGRMRRSGGRWSWIESYGNPRFSPEGRFLGLVCSSQDVTERMQAQKDLLQYRDHLEELVKERTDELEERNRKLGEEINERIKAEEEKRAVVEQLAHARKIEALGRFAGGIAHDLNNMLYPIIIESESLLDEMPPDTPWHQTVQQILTAAYRQRDLVKQILSFSRRSEQRFTPISIKPLISETLAFVRSSLPSTIEIRQHIDAVDDTVMGDASQIQQVIMNLCKNAADALPSQSGVMEISLTNTRLTKTEDHPEVKAGEYVKLSVRDFGSGMTPEVIPHIFEPFYTTKEVGKGVGMGLPVIHGIVRDHGGTITVESEPGKGSRFAVFFPVTRARPAVQKLCAGGAHHARGNILLVDDERPVLSSVNKALKRLGYSVTAVEDSMEALALFSRNSEAFDLVVTDLTMPRMNGVDLAAKIREVRSDIPIILCTGFNDVITEQEARSKGIAGLIFKPACTADLDTAVGLALKTRATS
jgi:PAS domain S-box-containing protein